MDGPSLTRVPSIFGYQWKELASTQPGLFFASLLQLGDKSCVCVEMGL